MYDTLIIIGSMTLVRDGDTWTHNGQDVDPRAIIRDIASRQAYVEVQAIRTDGIVDVYEYVDGRYYHTTFAINRGC